MIQSVLFSRCVLGVRLLVLFQETGTTVTVRCHVCLLFFKKACGRQFLTCLNSLIYHNSKCLFSLNFSQLQSVRHDAYMYF